MSSRAGIQAFGDGLRDLRWAAGADTWPAQPARHALLASSMKLYRELVEDESLDIEWENRGLLLVFKSAHEFEAYGQIAALMRDEFGVVATAYDSTALTALEPALRPGPAGAWHYPGDAHLRPDRLMAEMQSLLRRAAWALWKASR